MELRKRDESNNKDYAKKDEIEIKDIKKFTPKKWTAAATLGITSLFYANPNSMLGKVGIVFGCVVESSSVEINYSSTWHLWNNISNNAYSISNISIVVLLIVFIDYIVLKIKKFFDNQAEKKRLYIRILKVLFVIVVLSFLVNFVLDNYILDMNIPQFYENGKKEYVITSMGEIHISSLAQYDNTSDKVWYIRRHFLNDYKTYQWRFQMLNPELEMIVEGQNLENIDKINAYLSTEEQEKTYTIKFEYDGDFIKKALIIENE